MSEAANDAGLQIQGLDDHEPTNDVAVIRAQTFESLQILRNLLSLMMPKEDDDGPKLVDLIAALVAQQRDIAVGITRIQSDLNALFDRFDEIVGRGAPAGGRDIRR